MTIATADTILHKPSEGPKPYLPHRFSTTVYELRRCFICGRLAGALIHYVSPPTPNEILREEQNRRAEASKSLDGAGI